MQQWQLLFVYNSHKAIAPCCTNNWLALHQVSILSRSSSYRLHCMPSHLIASSPARCRVVRPPGNLDRGQSFTIWLIVCFAAPQLQDGSGILRQRARFAAHCPWPVLKWFKFAHWCRGKLKPGGRAVGSSTKDWLITSVPSHSSHHSSRADKLSRCILGIRWFHHTTNAEVSSQSCQENLVRRRHMAVFGHVRRLPEEAPGWMAIVPTTSLVKVII